MRAAYHLAFAAFSLGTVATPTTAPNATDQTAPSISAPQQHAIHDAVRSIPADPSAKLNSRQEAPSAPRSARSASIGEALPESIELHPIPQHETYRYAVVNDHRVIVDAASRKVVYIIR